MHLLSLLHQKLELFLVDCNTIMTVPVWRTVKSFTVLDGKRKPSQSRLSMGSGCSSIDQGKVIDIRYRNNYFLDRKKEDSFQQIIATLPKLFCEISNDSGRFLFSCNVTQNLQFLVFACTDMNRNNFYQKIVSMDEFKEIKKMLDIKETLNWPSFLNSLKAAFEKRTLVHEFDTNNNSPSGGELCRLGLEVALEKIGRVHIQLNLRESVNKSVTLSNSFLAPLYDFYAIRTESSPPEKVDELERKLKLLKEKYVFLKGQKRKPNNNNNATQNGNEQHLSKKKGTKSQMAYPKEDILKFLGEFKKKFINSKVITEKEQDSLNRLINTICFDNLYKLEFSNKISKEIDPDVLAWIKNKFSLDIQGEGRRHKKSSDTTMGAVDFKKSIDTSTINKTKTRLDIIAMFDKVDDWNFDVFALERLTEGQTLFITGYTLFLKYDLLNKFNIEEPVLINWLKKIDMGYHPNPYHNAMHAADVLQVLHFIIYKGNLAQFMSDEDILASLIAAIIHDNDHPGLSNAFQINSESYLATLYNDRSVLENHHCSQAFEMMKCDKYNILKNLSTDQQKEVRETVIQMVLSTDMSQHAKYIGKFNSRIETDLNFSAKEDVRLALQIAIKIADVSNPSRPNILYLKWVDRLETEYYKQGDKERELSLGVSPFMDRQKPSLNNLQHAFITYIVNPMFESFYKLLPKMQHYTKNHIEQNLAYWLTHNHVNPNDINEELN